MNIFFIERKMCALDFLGGNTFFFQSNTTAKGIFAFPRGLGFVALT